MNVLKNWLEKNRGEGRQLLLAKLRETFPRVSSTSLSQYANGRRIPDKTKAQIIAHFIGVPLEQIPYRMVNRPGLETQASPVPEKIITPLPPGNGGDVFKNAGFSLIKRIFGGKTEPQAAEAGVKD